jgi:hypothetical protein
MTQPLTWIIADVDPTSPNYKISQTNLARTLAQALKYSWSVSVWPAVVGDRVTEQTWRDIGVELLDRGAIVKRPGARGCWHSHWGLWNHCVTIDRPIVVLEHDAYISGVWPRDIDLDQCVWKLHKPDGRGLRENTITGTWSCGAYSYTLTPTFAQQLIDFSKTHGAQAVDKQIGSRAVPWQYWTSDLAPHRPHTYRSTTSPKR